MKALTLNPGNQVSKVDMVLCLCAIALGGAIVFFNHTVPEPGSQTQLGQYMERILGHMDAMGGQLSDWYVQDTRSLR